ncbi:hypothetical protein L596_012787 [Steinernema carpocapsae]|uniref:Uncharacterized protein n=1 Tax=Steinernema carpocapsae TaxID=34508 RepID=A0A4U5NZ00_STECR|nr:hypothetical protein L596_012787 [Steinernema carpocapsae]
MSTSTDYMKGMVIKIDDQGLVHFWVGIKEAFHTTPFENASDDVKVGSWADLEFDDDGNLTAYEECIPPYEVEVRMHNGKPFEIMMRCFAKVVTTDYGRINNRRGEALNKIIGWMVPISREIKDPKAAAGSPH